MVVAAVVVRQAGHCGWGLAEIEAAGKPSTLPRTIGPLHIFFGQSIYVIDHQPVVIGAFTIDDFPFTLWSQTPRLLGTLPQNFSYP